MVKNVFFIIIATKRKTDLTMTFWVCCKFSYDVNFMTSCMNFDSKKATVYKELMRVNGKAHTNGLDPFVTDTYYTLHRQLHAIYE